MSTIEELEEGLQINEHALDEAVQQQPAFFYQVSQKLALYISRRDAAKQLLEDAEAKHSVNIRTLAKKNDVKTTEGEIAAQLRLHPDVKKARDKFFELSDSVGQYAALKESFQQRSYALGHMVDLYVAGYFSDLMPNKSTDRMKDARADAVKREVQEMRNRGKGSRA